MNVDNPYNLDLKSTEPQAISKIEPMNRF